MRKENSLTKSYSKLLIQLKTVFIQGLQKIESEKIKVYWQAGKLISDYLLENKPRAAYGENVFEKLSLDLNIAIRTLQQAVQFYRTVPITHARAQLSWSHFRILASIKDARKRNAFIQKALTKSWSERELRQAVHLDRITFEGSIEKPNRQAKKLPVTRARLYTYQVLEPSYIHPIEEWLTIDLGFTTLIHKEIKGLRLREGEFIESSKAGKSYSFKHSHAKPKELFTYKALVERVVDADTIWLNIDLGFSCWSRQKIRLRGIDAPELSTKKGIEAKQFVEARLKQVSFVVVKTYKSDKYDRYLTDVFYPPFELRRVGSPEELRRACRAAEENPQAVLSEGTFLNQELLDADLAQVM